MKRVACGEHVVSYRGLVRFRCGVCPDCRVRGRPRGPLSNSSGSQPEAPSTPRPTANGARVVRP